MKKNELPGYRIGFQEGFIEGQKAGWEMTAKTLAKIAADDIKKQMEEKK